MTPEEIAFVRNSLQRIETALRGDEMGNLGVLPRLSRAENKLEVHDRKFLQWGAVMFTTGTVILFIKDPLIKWFGL